MELRAPEPVSTVPEALERMPLNRSEPFWRPSSKQRTEQADGSELGSSFPGTVLNRSGGIANCLVMTAFWGGF